KDSESQDGERHHDAQHPWPLTPQARIHHRGFPPCVAVASQLTSHRMFNHATTSFTWLKPWVTFAGTKNRSPTLPGAVTPVPGTRSLPLAVKPVFTVPLPSRTTQVSIVRGCCSAEGALIRLMLTLKWPPSISRTVARFFASMSRR